MALCDWSSDVCSSDLHIPSNIDDCSNLQVLSLAYNQLSGIIPRSIGNLTKLKVIYLDANDLEGKFLYLIIYFC